MCNSCRQFYILQSRNHFWLVLWSLPFTFTHKKLLEIFGQSYLRAQATVIYVFSCCQNIFIRKVKNKILKMFLNTKNISFSNVKKANLTHAHASVSWFEYMYMLYSSWKCRFIIISSLFYLSQKALWLTAPPLLLLQQQQTANSKKWLLILQKCKAENENPTKGEQRKKVEFGLLLLF